MIFLNYIENIIFHFSFLVPLAIPSNLEVTASSYSTLKVTWDAAPGATQYMLLYSALNNGEPEDALEVRE